MQRSWLYSLYFWLVVVPLMVIATLGFGLACLLTGPLIGPRAAGQLYAVPWSRLGLLLCGVSVSVDGSEHIRPGQSYVVVANHLSHFDIWVLYGYLGLDIRWVAKQEVRRLPVVGLACVVLGHVFIDRSDRQRAVASIRAAQDQVRDGTCILFFPEGTRSRDGHLQPFKKGAFKMAAELQLPVLPVVIDGTWDVLPPDRARVRPGHVHVHVQPALAPQPDTDAGIQRLLEASRARIATGRHAGQPATA